MDKTLRLSKEKKTQLDKKTSELNKIYGVRSFKTTTESIEYTRRVAGAMSSFKGDFKNAEISQMFDFFDPKLIKYVVGGFVFRKDKKKFKYEKEFVNDFDTLMLVFTMVVKFLSQKANGEGKSQEDQKISSTRRL